MATASETIHERAQKLRDIWLRTRPRGPGARRRLREKLAFCAGMAVDEAVRPHHKLRPGVDSCRTGDWHVGGFEALSETARTVHRETGYSDATCRLIARALHREQYTGLPACPVDPVYWGHQESGDSERRYLDRHHADWDENARRWYLFHRWHVGRALAEMHGRERIAACRRDPAYRISGYLASSILSWQGIDGGHDYRGCSGCGSYQYHYEHPEQWAELLAHAPIGASGDGWEQVFPHEVARAARLDAAGWYHTLRMDDSLYTAQDPILRRGY